MASGEPLSRQAMADRIAMEFEDGWVVNLGVGMPTLCSNFVHPGREITYQSENGLVNYGPLAVEDDTPARCLRITADRHQESRFAGISVADQ